MREGRVDVSYSGGGGELTCKRCGTPISLGNLCSNCIKLLSGQIKSASTPIPPTAAPENRARDDKKRRMFVAGRLKNED